MVAGAQGYRYTLTVLDHYSRYVSFSPLKPNTLHTSLNTWTSVHGGLRDPSRHRPGQRRRVHQQGVPTVLQTSPHHPVLHHAVPPTGERHNRENAQDSQVHPCCSLSRLPSTVAQAATIVPSRHEPSRSHFHRAGTLLHLFFPSSPKAVRCRTAV